MASTTLHFQLSTLHSSCDHVIIARTNQVCHVPLFAGATYAVGVILIARKYGRISNMKKDGSRLRFDAVVLANGAFPRKGAAEWNVLAAAKRVVACDGAADAYRRRFGKSPFAVVGDFDSIRVFPEGSEIVRDSGQDTNDLEKAVRWCRAQGFRRLVVVGATGGREDHAIGNVFRALDLGVEIVTDQGRFVPVEGSASLRVAKGAAVSVFATDPATRMTSKGLAWPLDGVRFGNLYCATLNRASAATVRLTATRRVLVFVGEDEA